MKNRSIYWAIGAFVVGVILGWWLGTLGSEEVVREEVRYVERPATNIRLKNPIPTKIEPITIPQVYFIERRDAIRDNVTIYADTASIIADYLQRREYNLDFSTDTTGVFKLNAIVEANHLTSAEATIIPLQREVQKTVVKQRNFRPFIGGSVGIGNNIGVSVNVGALIKDHHSPSIGYQRFGKDNFLIVGYGYVF